MKTTVIHHSADFDGLFSREIAHKFIPEAELIGWDYGNPKLPFPDEGTVYVVDLSPECFTLTPDDLPMRADGGFDGTYNRLIWIDHHKSAIDRFPTHINGYRIDGVAACRLAWQFFTHRHPNGEFFDGEFLPKKQDFVDRLVIEPRSVRLAGEYDIWDKRDPDAALFQHGLRLLENASGEWQMMIQIQNPTAGGIVDELLERGRDIAFVREQEYRGVITQQGFGLQWEGLNFLCCNHARFNSFLFTAGIKPEHDALMGFCWDGSQWKFSLYHIDGKTEHDLSLIAKKYGGGGHRGACGFRVKELPFVL